MSLVGNFTFGSYDKTAETTGSPAASGGRPFARRPSIVDGDPANEDHTERKHSFVRKFSSTGRRPSVVSTSGSQKPSSIPPVPGHQEQAGTDVSDSTTPPTEQREADPRREH